MKKLMFLTLALCLTASMAFAAQEAAVLTLKGYIVDNKCASGQDAAGMEEFAKNHPKSCALMPECVASGYAIYADHMLQQFDADSNTKIEQFLKQDGSMTLVEVTANKNGDKLSLISIKNAQ